MTRKPDWSPGCWYDAALLPTLDHSLSDVAKNQLIERLCEMTWDIIVKIYDPKADAFVYKRVPNATVRTEYLRKARAWVFSPILEDLPDGGRIVAIMPQPIWQEIYETRLELGNFDNDRDATELFNEKT